METAARNNGTNATASLGPLLGLTALWVVNVVLLLRIFGSAGPVVEGGEPAMASLSLAADAAVEQALACSLSVRTVPYDTSFEAPFRVTIAGSGPLRAGARAADPQRPRLTLKGILTGDRPLAILENGKGETHIRGVADTLFGQKVVRIRGDRVTLRDRRGTYEVTVEE